MTNQGINILNKKTVVLLLGHVHFLTHQNWTFNHVISLKVQTDNLERIEATSADNIIMSVTSTVNWRIVDVQTAALMAAETMKMDMGSTKADISKLRKDVLKQAMASLASFIGSVNYSDSFHLAAAAQVVTIAILVHTSTFVVLFVISCCAILHAIHNAGWPMRYHSFNSKALRAYY